MNEDRSGYQTMKPVSLLRNLWMVALLGTAGGLYSVSIESKEVVSKKMAAPLKILLNICGLLWQSSRMILMQPLPDMMN